MSQTFNSTFTINGGSEQTGDETETITLEPLKYNENGTQSLHTIEAIIGYTNPNRFPNQEAQHGTLGWENDHAYNIALLDCQWEDGITGIQSFAFDQKSAVKYPDLPDSTSNTDYYSTHFLEYLLELEKIYYETDDGYKLSRLFDKIQISWPDGFAYNYSADASCNRLGLREGSVQGPAGGSYLIRDMVIYDGVAVPETLFFEPTLSPEEYDRYTGEGKNIYHPGSSTLWEGGFHYIIPRYPISDDDKLGFTLLVFPNFFSQLMYGYSDSKNQTGWGESFTIDVLAFHFNYKIFDGKVIALKNIQLTRHNYSNPVPFQISGDNITYHAAHHNIAFKDLYYIGSLLEAKFKMRHKVHVTTARGKSDKSITVLDTITKIEQIEFDNKNKILNNGRQIYTDSPRVVSPFRNVGRITTRYTLNDRDNRELIISPSIKQIEKLVLRPENYLESNTETCFSLDGDANINITSPNLSIKKMVLNGLLTISEDK